jgi:hypothetical protein
MASPKTPGALGWNDAANPDTPDAFVGFTPGSLGVNDCADPKLAAAKFAWSTSGRVVLLASAGPSLPVGLGTDPYRPGLNISDSVLKQNDSMLSYVDPVSGVDFKSAAGKVASDVGINPGLLVADLLAEYAHPAAYFPKAATVDGEPFGSDSYYEHRKAIASKVPGGGDVHIESHRTWPSEQGNPTEIATFRSSDLILSSAKYLKFGELEMRRYLEEEANTLKVIGIDFDRLPPDVRFALTRLWVNPGKRGKRYYAKLLTEGKDILVRTPIHGQAANRPQAGATLVAARAIHYSQDFYGIEP